MEEKLSLRAQVLFVILISLSAFYPAIFGEVLSIDDFPLIVNILNVKQIDIKSLFLSKNVGSYYRPLLYLSFILEGKLVGAQQSLMHLTNILIHTMSSILVYFIVKASIDYFRLNRDNFSYMPFFVALIFSVHPINTESVCWISGRTDLLAGLFVFISLLIIFGKGVDSFWGVLVASLFYLFGLLSKEVAVGMIPLVLFLGIYKNEKDIRLGKRVFLIVSFLFITVFYFYMRNGLIIHNDSGISNIINITQQDTSMLVKARGIMKAVGFYFKKAFIPYPLNFAITEIPTYIYLPLGFFIVFFCIYLLLFKKDSFGAFWFVFLISFYLPAIPLVLAKITWTPLAERYLYISSLGASVLIVAILMRLPYKKIKISFLCLIIVIFGITTYKRAVTWRSNLTLFADTVKKNPDFAPVRNEYASALLKKGLKKEAEKEFLIAKKLSDGTSYILPELNLAILTADPTKKIKTIEAFLSKDNLSPRFRLELLETLAFLYEKSLMSENDKGPLQVKELYNKLIKTYEEIFKITYNGFYKYRIGQLYLSIGEKRKALENFKEAARLSPNEYFSPAARKLVKKLEAELADKARES